LSAILFVSHANGDPYEKGNDGRQYFAKRDLEAARIQPNSSHHADVVLFSRVNILKVSEGLSERVCCKNSKK
jgi:hypothetical protein